MDSYVYKSRVFVGASLLIVLSRCLFSSAIPVSRAPRIGIVGAGIGGAMTAHFVRNLFGTDVKIDVYEKSHVGGRLSLIEIKDKKFEAGGSIIHARNRYMDETAKLLNLERAKRHNQRSGIHNGKEFVFEESSFSYLTYVDLIWRYGLSIMKWNRLIAQMLDRFDNIYTNQDNGYAYTTVEKLLYAMDPDFVNMTQTTASEFLKRQGFSDSFIQEIAMAAVRVNYGQTTDINAFVGALSLAAAQPTLWSVEGGNYQLAEGALTLCGANYKPQEVSVIKLTRDGTYQLSTTSGAVDQKYDIVIITAPQTKDLRNIKFEGFLQPLDDSFPGSYHQTIATFVEGIVNASHFSTQYSLSIPDDIISISDDMLFNSLSRNYPVDDVALKEMGETAKVYKVFSSELLSTDQLDLLFTERTVTKPIDWLAYPHYSPPEKLGDFRLHDFLYYTSAIEWAGSAMEMSAVAARNAALLAYNEYNDLPKIDLVFSQTKKKTEL